MTVTQKPVSPGRARHSPLTPSRRECRCFGFACSDYACVLLPFAHKAAGAGQTPGIPCALFSSRACTFSKLGQDSAAGILTRGYRRVVAILARDATRLEP